MEIKYQIDKIMKNNFKEEKKFPRLKFGNYDQCKDFLLKTMHEMDKTTSKFEFLPEYEGIVNWMMDTKGKGLGMIGSCGRGKTTILYYVLPKLFVQCCNWVLHPIPIENFASEKYYLDRSMAGLDDVGVESIVNEYGNVYEPFSKVVGNCEAQSKLLFFTTNLTANMIIERYGWRIYDRLLRLVEIVPFNGESFRK